MNDQSTQTPAIEDIINAASQLSRIPLLEKDAAIGIVPYIHNGDAIPRILAAGMPRTPIFLPWRD